MTTDVADAVVIGGGSGGYAAALRSAELGQKVVLVEMDKVGGTCLHRGCVPTKALLHAAEVVETTRSSSSMGVRSTYEGIDMPALIEYQQGIVNRNWKGLSGLIAARGIRTVQGRGRLTSKDTVHVGEDEFVADHIIVATGSTPRALPGVQVDGRRVITSDQALSLERVPASAIILGGGVIGCEFASAWVSFGTSVTVVEALPRLVAREDEAASKLLERAFRRRGISTRLGTRVDQVDAGEESVRVTLSDGGLLEAEVLLIAIGRDPVTGDCGLEDVGVTLRNGFVDVDEYCRTSVSNIFAVGDVIATPQLAHVGFAEGILVAEQIAHLRPSPIRYSGVPRVAYCSPEVAAVGLTEREAVDLYGREMVRTVTYDLAGNARSAMLHTKGAVKLVSLNDGVVLGIHLVGDRVSELIAEAQLIYNWDAPASHVAELIHPHPTQSEAIGEAFLALAGKPLHAHT